MPNLHEKLSSVDDKTMRQIRSIYYNKIKIIILMFIPNLSSQ